MALNRQGAKTKLGSAWDARGVKRLLSNPLYGGMLVNHKYEIEDFLTGRQVALPEQERFYHQRPEWAIVPPERFRRAQEILASRRRQYASGEPFREGRYSAKHPFSTLIKCAHCGRSFCRKSYTYQNTRVYWRCVTNDQYTAEGCDNHVILDEKELLDALKAHLTALIPDRKAFIAGVQEELARRNVAADPARRRMEVQTKQKRLLQKRSRWQELYANDLLTLEALRERLTTLDRELQAVAQQLDAPVPPGSDAGCSARIEDFLTLQTSTNADLRRLIDHITVSRDGNVQVVLRKLDGAA